MFFVAAEHFAGSPVSICPTVLTILFLHALIKVKIDKENSFTQ